MQDLLSRADEARAKSDFRGAEKLYLQAAKQSSLRSDALLGVADCGRLLGKFAQAAKAYQQAIAALGRQDAERAMDAKAGLALSLRGMGKPKEALSILKQAEAHYRKAKDPEGLAFIAWAWEGPSALPGRCGLPSSTWKWP